MRSGPEMVVERTIVARCGEAEYSRWMIECNDKEWLEWEKVETRRMAGHLSSVGAGQRKRGAAGRGDDPNNDPQHRGVIR